MLKVLLIIVIVMQGIILYAFDGIASKGER